MYDTIFIGDKTLHNKSWKEFKTRFPMLKSASNLDDAKRISITKMFWVIWPDIVLDHKFNFDYVVDEWSTEYVHVFKNGDTYDGVCLIPKSADINQKEFEHRFFVNKKEVDLNASRPRPFDFFKIDSYNEYLHALENSTTEMFWMSSTNIQSDANLIQNYYISHHDSQLRQQTHAFIHQVDNQRSYNGLFLCSKRRELTKREVEYRFPVDRIERDIIGSIPVNYDVFEIDSYDEYLHALENSTTEMFWMSSANISATIPDIYFTHDNEYDRKQNHAFIHKVNDIDYYNGLFLCSKHVPLSKKEVEHRFLVNRKEWDIVGSGPKKYDVFEIDSYDEYLYALENSTTEMFWMSSANISATIPDLYFTHDNEYDRKQNHAFIHKVNDIDYYNGLFLCSKHVPLSKKEVEHRHPVNRKEWDIEVSGPKKYDVFEIDSYNEYLYALENSTTEMFWMSSANISATIPDLYFTHDNEYDRKQNHAFIHCNDKRNGLFLCSKHVPLTEREVKYRFLVNAKEWDIEVSGPKKYDVFEIDSYDEYLYALENSTTEMFWMSSANISATIPDLYFTHDNEYDRKQNHAFIHKVNNIDYYNGLFLCSKHVPLSKKEVEHRFLVNRKEWDIEVSGPKKYDVFEIDSYDEYLHALENSTTEMFWIIPSTVDVDNNFIFDTYFTHDNTFDRQLNHAYLNGKYHDGIILCSKKRKISAREWQFKFIAGKKEHTVLASYPKSYDMVFISYQEPNADKNYQQLLQRFPNCKRVHGVKGIHQAHISAAKLCSTPMFWIVDGDAEILDTFEFDYQVPAWQYSHVHVWRSKNPINGLVYGYGGVKLFPRELTINMDTGKPDMTTSISNKFVAVKEISNITGFNTGEFETWRSAFRECCKLSSKVIDRQKDEETERRLKIWCSIGRDKPFGKLAIAGARAGMAYGNINKDNAEALKKINDFDWLKEQFDGNL